MIELSESYLNYLDISNLNEQELKEHMVTIITESKVSIDSLEKSYKKNIAVTENYLKKFKVNINYIKSEAKKAASFITKQHSKGIPASDTSKMMVQTIGKKVLEKIKSQIKTNEGSYEEELTEKIIRSLGIFCVMLFVSSMLSAMASSIIVPIYGTKMAMAFGAVVIAPFIEEYAKRFALLKDHPFIYTGIFAGIEALLYIVMMTTQGVALGTALVLRAAAIGLHFATAAIQKLFHDRGIEIGNENSSITGYYVAVGVHSLWNFLAVMPMFAH